jgi:hypothetical protein
MSDEPCELPARRHAHRFFRQLAGGFQLCLPMFSQLQMHMVAHDRVFVKPIALQSATTLPPLATAYASQKLSYAFGTLLYFRWGTGLPLLICLSLPDRVTSLKQG